MAACEEGSVAGLFVVLLPRLRRGTCGDELPAEAEVRRKAETCDPTTAAESECPDESPFSRCDPRGDDKELLR